LAISSPVVVVMALGNEVMLSLAQKLYSVWSPLLRYLATLLHVCSYSCHQICLTVSDSFWSRVACIPPACAVALALWNFMHKSFAVTGHARTLYQLVMLSVTKWHVVRCASEESGWKCGKRAQIQVDTWKCWVCFIK
jgi:hypothetical protein